MMYSTWNLGGRLASRDRDGFNVFVTMWSRWWSRVPASLAREDPGMLTHLLELGLRPGGISQSDVQRELGINQPRLSKLMRKLLDEGWIRVKKSESDSRVKLMTTTATAKDRVAKIKVDLAASLPANAREQVPPPPRRSRASAGLRDKGVKPQRGQITFELAE